MIVLLNLLFNACNNILKWNSSVKRKLNSLNEILYWYDCDVKSACKESGTINSSTSRYFYSKRNGSNSN